MRHPGARYRCLHCHQGAITLLTVAPSASSGARCAPVSGRLCGRSSASPQQPGRRPRGRRGHDRSTVQGELPGCPHSCLRPGWQGTHFYSRVSHKLLSVHNVTLAYVELTTRVPLDKGT